MADQGDQRRQDRRQGQRRAPAAGRALVPLDPPEEAAGRPASPAAPPTPADPAFAAQLLGQSGQKRGLKGGAPVLDQARAVYLGREYSGDRERRPRAGRKTVTDI
ncbi:MAG: hypothetical protein KF910_04935 [Brevundimonas sp.]|uniref:hypothetical protein n=1 Tax=Brevundimonas sp. TaxID=1871086 RepID=UPI0025B86D61|nr:hypothetical protein [Brevundimonas sp.]MBX3476928.1 hypothetical protein [Brevundimonas sp.]